MPTDGMPYPFQEKQNTSFKKDHCKGEVVLQAGATFFIVRNVAVLRKGPLKRSAKN
jgi:hypothetical protein